MIHESAVDRKSGRGERRPLSPAIIARKSNGPQSSDANALRQRLGNQGMQRLVLRELTPATDALTVQRDTSQLEEEQRDKDRRDRRSTDSRRDRQALGLPDPFDNFDSDWAGRMILGQYLYGGGRAVDVRDDPAWTAYMTRSRKLRSQVWVQVVAMARELAGRGNAGRRATLTRFSAEVENGEGIIGYQYLHGTNKNAGDFFIVGFAETTQFHGPHRTVVPSRNPFVPPLVSTQGAGVRVDLELSFIWNDIIDPNPIYLSDRIKSAIAYIFTLGQPRNYRLSIGWRDKCSVWLPVTGGQGLSGGYPAL